MDNCRVYVWITCEKLDAKKYVRFGAKKDMWVWFMLWDESYWSILSNLKLPQLNFWIRRAENRTTNFNESWIPEIWFPHILLRLSIKALPHPRKIKDWFICSQSRSYILFHGFFYIIIIHDSCEFKELHWLDSFVQFNIRFTAHDAHQSDPSTRYFHGKHSRS